MFETLFGSEIPLAARFFIAFLVVLGLIALTAWLVRRFGSNRLGSSSARGRQPRLAVIDAASVDGRRRLVLIRRDNIEHLLMIGGPTDVVVEQNIVRAAAAREPVREPAAPRIGAPGEPASRGVPAIDNGHPLQPTPEPQPAPRPYRPTVTDEPWLAQEPGGRARPAADSLTGLAAELSARLNPPETGKVTVRAAPNAPRAPEPIVGDAPPAEGDQGNLNEMAQKLEAALRRSAVSDGRPPVTDPLAVPYAGGNGKHPEPPRTAARESRPRSEPRVEPKLEPRFDAKPEPKIEPKPEPAKDFYDNLEQEMASLLGRPTNKP